MDHSEELFSAELGQYGLSSNILKADGGELASKCFLQSLNAIRNPSTLIRVKVMQSISIL